MPYKSPRNVCRCIGMERNKKKYREIVGNFKMTYEYTIETTAQRGSTLVFRVFLTLNRVRTRRKIGEIGSHFRSSCFFCMNDLPTFLCPRYESCVRCDKCR